MGALHIRVYGRSERARFIALCGGSPCVLVDDKCRAFGFSLALGRCVAEQPFDMRYKFIYNRFSPNRMMESFTVLLCV